MFFVVKDLGYDGISCVNYVDKEDALDDVRDCQCPFAVVWGIVICNEGMFNDTFKGVAHFIPVVNTSVE